MGPGFKLVLGLIIGLVTGILFVVIESSFISRSDEYRNSGFQIFLWKLGWFVGGFLIGCNGFWYYFK